MSKDADKIFDFVIIGSGFGGMCCAYILADEGYSVALLEKNIQYGGCLQIFSRDKFILDTGLHYIGGFDPGQNLNTIFHYLGLADKMKFHRMDENGFDIISFSDGRKFKHGMGYENFIQQLVKDFPEEEKAIHAFCKKIQEVCKQFPIYHLKDEQAENYLDVEVRGENAHDYLASITNNIALRNVLAGNNMLYAGVKEKTPLFVLALIFNSYICGSYKIVTGGAQLIRQFSQRLREKGVKKMNRHKVVSAIYDDNKISALKTDNDETIYGKKFISTIHPSATIDIFGQENFYPAFVKRINNLENTTSSFIVQLTFKPYSFPYLNHNIYHYFTDDVWETINYSGEDWPLGFYLTTPVPVKNKSFAESLTVMCYMQPEDVAPWVNTFNSTVHPGSRGDDYEKFKKQKEELVIKKLETLYPGIRNSILHVYSSSPLTFRDYTNSVNGSIYGILKNSNSPLSTVINSRTKIPNLYLSGQNLIFHGVLGTSIGAIVTCFEFVNRKKLMEKINSFSQLI